MGDQVSEGCMEGAFSHLPPAAARCVLLCPPHMAPSASSLITSFAIGFRVCLPMMLSSQAPNQNIYRDPFSCKDHIPRFRVAMSFGGHHSPCYRRDSVNGSRRHWLRTCWGPDTVLLSTSGLPPRCTQADLVRCTGSERWRHQPEVTQLLVD